MKKNIKIRDIDKLSYEEKKEAYMKFVSTITVDQELDDLFNKINEKFAEIRVREEMALRMMNEDYSDKEISYITRIRLSDIEILKKKKNI